MKNRSINFRRDTARIAAAVLLLVAGNTLAADPTEEAGKPPSAGKGPQEQRTPEQEAQHRAALDLAQRLPPAMAEHEKAVEDYKEALFGGSRPRMLSDEESSRAPRFPEVLINELKAMNAEQIRTMAQAMAGDVAVDGRERSSRLGFLLSNWLAAQEPEGVPPLLTVLGILEKYLPDLPPLSRTYPLIAIMPNPAPEPKSAAMADFMIRHRELWSAEPGDVWGDILRKHLLESGIDDQRKKGVEELPHHAEPGQR